MLAFYVGFDLRGKGKEPEPKYLYDPACAYV